MWWLDIRLMRLLTWSAEQFVAHSHIYPGLTGKVLSLTHFPLELGYEDYSFLNRAVADFEQVFHSILTNCLETPELDTSLDEPDAFISWVSGFLCSVSTPDNTKLQLAPSIRSNKLWCQARAILAPVLASKLICYFSSHPAASRFWSSTPPDNITLTSANRKADQPLSNFKTGVAAAHATLDMLQVISYLWVALVDTISSLQNSEGGIIPVSKVCELLLKVHDILDNAVSKQVGNSAQMLAHVLNSVSR